MIPDRRRSQVITFYSFKGGVGRTMALANVAWILASTGRRVLAVDWDLESPGLHRYFSPFLRDRDLRHSPGVINATMRFSAAATRADSPLNSDEIRDLAKIKDFATSLERYDFPKGGSIDFVPAGEQVAEYSRMVSHFDWDHFYTRLNGEEFLLALADDMRRNYDIALIDSRTGLSDNAGICTVALPDAVVNCFGFNNQSIEGAVAIARNIRRLRPRGVRMFPVPTRVEDGETAKLDRRRSLAQQRFAEYVAALGYSDASKYWGSVEIPYKVFYAYEETLAAFGDRSHQEGTLLAAYERLASELVGERCTLAAISEASRQAWAAEFEHRGVANPDNILIAYIPRDRIWAEWVQHQLRAAGQRCAMQDMTGQVNVAEAMSRVDRLIVLLSRESMHTPQILTWWDAGGKREAPGAGRFLVSVRVDGYPLQHPFDARESVEMVNLDGRRARQALLNRLAMRDVLEAEGLGPAAPTPRFPFEPARVWQVPARNTNFVGRDAALEELRGRLNSSNAMAGPAVLQGIGGVGKTQIATEYLHRFAADYDIAWWISADQPAMIVTALADLAQKLELPIAGRADEQVQSVLESLRLGVPFDNWVIVFDNHTMDPELLRPYLPTGNGDVIVTTPGQEWSRQAWTLDVNVFDRSESVSLLMRRVGGLTADDADSIAAKLGDLPLAIEQAAALLEATAMSAASYLEILDEHMARILNEPPPPGYRHAVAETWRLSQRRLREKTPAAAFLVELCSFLSPEPIPTDLFDSAGMVEALATVDTNLRDKLMRSSLVREITRFGLARVDSVVWSDHPVRALKMHRLVQSVIRSDLPEQVRVIRQGQVHVILANARPGEPTDQKNWPAYQGLLAHLEPSDTLASPEPESRQLVIDTVRYLRYRGDYAGAQGLAERALALWVPKFGEDDLYVLRIRSELANTLLEHGEYPRSIETYADIVQRMSGSLGPTHPYTLVALGGQAAAYRGIGKYAEARLLDERTFTAWHAAQGGDGERTLMAANNLAISLRLMGDFAGAKLRDEDTLARYERTLAKGHRWTLLSRVAYGRDLREVGELVQSQAVLESVLTDCHKELGETDSITLSASKSLAVTLRRLGQTEESREVIDKTFAQYQRVFKHDHPNRLNCELEVACIESAQGNHEGAYTRARDVLERYQHAHGADHPFAMGAANDMAIFLLREGRFAEATPILEDAIDGFQARLPDHPYTVFCQMNLANARFAAGDIETARGLDEKCIGQLRRLFVNRSHPTLLAAAANLIASMRASGDQHGADALYDNTYRIAEDNYGAQYPHTVAIREGERINSDIEPPET
ncbi:hypothetical protein Rhe02_50220 [Rhizocola hellebori]|uniref:Tetratricopeptide repeat protein n=1 Tax=Rhizocola hellebori TaxID=1392758 RepID=A0A8J3VHX2_9ACTN|nr:FxSxx-COOH system tetratricopeptide repeat protein [Rhizocola hellebori]GIH06955.1 hypothetical protein Rhe02_50220 [Rhizocola hellebori]